MECNNPICKELSSLNDLVRKVKDADLHRLRDNGLCVPTEDEKECTDMEKVIKKIKEVSLNLQVIVNQAPDTPDTMNFLQAIKSCVKQAKCTLAETSASTSKHAPVVTDLTQNLAPTPSKEGMRMWPDPKNFDRNLKEFHPRFSLDFDDWDMVLDGESSDHVRRQCAREPIPQEGNGKGNDFRCICGSIFQSLDQLELHIEHMGEPPLRVLCNTCKFLGTGKRCMEFHREIHLKLEVAGKNDRYQCQRGCGKWFQSKHQRNLHNKETDRACKFQNATPRQVGTLAAGGHQNTADKKDIMKDNLPRKDPQTGGTECSSEKTKSVIPKKN